MPHTVVCAVGAIIDLTHADQPSGDRATLSKKTLSRKWCPGTESNRRHCDFQSHALPTELPGRRCVAGWEPAPASEWAPMAKAVRLGKGDRKATGRIRLRHACPGRMTLR